MTARTSPGPRQLGATTLEVDGSASWDLAFSGGGGAGRLLWARHDIALLAAGQALELELAAPWAREASGVAVEGTLAAIEGDGDGEGPGTGPVAMGALPFGPGLAGRLVVPRIVVCRRGGRAWATLVGPEQPGSREARAALRTELEELRRPPTSAAAPDEFDLRASMPHRDWEGLVARSVDQVTLGKFTKVVVARRVDVVANRPFVLSDVLARLASLYPSCTVFHFGGFIGASPELLVRRHGYEVTSHPLAGTIARSGDSQTDDDMVTALMASPKDRSEHAIVVEAIAQALGPVCSTLEVPGQPAAMMLRNVSHLGTAITGKLADVGPAQAPLNVLQLAALLHPTPAVGGSPRDAALRWQDQNEGFARGNYAGPVGWVDSRGDGEFVLGVRSAQVEGHRAQLFAGNGIVAGSVPSAELAETQLKLQALLAALVRP